MDSWWNHKLAMHIHDERIWVGYRAGFLAVDAQNLGALRETVRVEMGDYNSEYDAHKSRPIAREDNTLYVRRYWPGDLVAFDITDPNRPREIGNWSFSARSTIKIIDGWVYSADQGELSTYQLIPYHAHERVYSWRVPSSSFRRDWEPLHLVHGHLYLPIGGSLMVFSPEQIKGGRP